MGAPFDSPPPTEIPGPTRDPDGVDRSLIAWMLSLSPVERLRVNTRFVRMIDRLRNASR